MNMTVTESDKKLLSFLAAFLFGVVFLFLVFRPLVENIVTQKKEIARIEEQKREQELSASLSSEMSDSEEATAQQLAKVLQRYYPTLQSYETENMVTILALNHDLKVQNLSVLMPDKKSDLKWYQYANRAGDDMEYNEEEDEEQEEFFGIYAARVNCSVTGDETDLFSFIDDISENYPAISILSAEWATKQQMEVQSVSLAASSEEEETEDGEDAEEEILEQTVMKAVGELSLTLEIYMCEQ